MSTFVSMKELWKLIHIAAGTALQAANHGNDDLLVYVYGYPPEKEHAEILDGAI